MKPSTPFRRVFGQDQHKHVGCQDISPEEIELRYRAALYAIQERSRRRRLEVEPIRIGRGNTSN